ncbi:hypothetical protein KIPB_016762, partial [Kipferlia bialata]|eukprot:g16762.t1
MADKPKNEKARIQKQLQSLSNSFITLSGTLSPTPKDLSPL